MKYVNHRADLTYIIGEMIGELNCGHTYVGGGEYPKADRVKTGLLGAQIERDANSKYYRIKNTQRTKLGKRCAFTINGNRRECK